jgi:hypothetical protein
MLSKEAFYIISILGTPPRGMDPQETGASTVIGRDLCN